MQDTIANIESSNNEELEITFSVVKLTWLNGSDAHDHTQHGPLMLDFKTRKDANTAIDQGLTIDGTYCRASIYIPRVPQCFRCQDWGHRATECTGEAQCGKCAGSHETSQHSCTHANPCMPRE
ncbi:hypothetical protein M422DRAFT_169732 [Sphaerobolus stellatus SS14]|uniref:CCHC-type domain-containing protein n=1 Tax=Sphaerobolus stellatus (strain SS14) TaxID=990650 RepID=A0A0C9V985_SPHS4|nr:hypothetical protein M422DRAFT_169732 [Sphaerobolus stellatus SS14]